MEIDPQRVNQIQSAEISAVVIRADGTREDLGVIDSYRKPSWWRRVKGKLWRR